MPKSRGSRASKKTPNSRPELKGWKQIADFLGQPLAVVQRWSRFGMPVVRKGRYVTASPEQLNRWLGTESVTSQPVHIAGGDADLSADLKRALAYARQRA
jgi:hypothetical protein